MEKILNEIASFLKTLLCFVIACLLLPVLLLSFISVYYCDELVNYILSIKYPEYTISKSKKIRTLIDTKRNAGIFHFLIQVKGPCDFEKIKRYYVEHLTDARDRIGYLRFPKLRQKLHNCWGHYAWLNDYNSFHINNHILLSASTYRGRPVNDVNIQDFASDLVGKYIPSDLPQWQVIVIPTMPTTSGNILPEESTESELQSHYYILVKVHHLLIAEEEDLHISDMLMVRENTRKEVIDFEDMRIKKKSQNVSYFIRKPEHIQNLMNHIGKLIVNRWNAFIYEFESLETPDGCVCVQITNISQLLSVLLIILVNVCIDYWNTIKLNDKLRNKSRHYKHSLGRIATLKLILWNEIEQRNLSWEIAIAAVRKSWHPVNLIKTITHFIWQANVHYVLLLPYHIYCELMAIRDLIFKGHTKLMFTYSGRLAVYLPMIIYAQIEFFKICYELYKAPVNIYDELFVRPSKESNYLQTKSYSGRKIISFSKSIDATELRKRINFSEEIRESDVVLACLAGALCDYFAMFPKPQVPKILNTTCRTIAKGYFTENTGDKTENIGGVVFLQLPLKCPDREHARQLHQIVKEIRQNQIMIYLASIGQTKFDLMTALVPRLLTQICINFFSFHFPVTITEIHGANSEFMSVWGQKVEDVLLFRPPQSKTCLSLNIHRFGNKYRLAVMADTQLGPDHALIAHSFENYMDTITL